MFFCQICEISKKTYFIEHLLMTDSGMKGTAVSEASSDYFLKISILDVRQGSEYASGSLTI